MILKGDNAAEKKTSVRKQSDEVLEGLYASKPEMKEYLKEVVGCATFNQKDVNLFRLSLLTSNVFAWSLLVAQDSSKAFAVDDPKAKLLTERWLKNTQERLDLWKKYHKEISQALSSIRGAQFLQIENQMLCSLI